MHPPCCSSRVTSFQEKRGRRANSSPICAQPGSIQRLQQADKMSPEVDSLCDTCKQTTTSCIHCVYSTVLFYPPVQYAVHVGEPIRCLLLKMTRYCSQRINHFFNGNFLHHTVCFHLHKSQQNVYLKRKNYPSAMVRHRALQSGWFQLKTTVAQL